MSIRSRQYDIEFRRAMLDQLKSGVKPNSNVIHREAIRKLSQWSPGSPKFKPTPIRKGTVSDPALFNGFLSDIHEDLTVAIEELDSLQGKVDIATLAHKSDRLRLLHQAYLLERRVHDLNIKARLRKNTVFNTFADFKYVDFLGNSERGIPATTAHIDLTTNSATMNIQTGSYDAVFVSAPHHAGATVFASLEVDQWLPPGTTISYFVGADNNSDSINWRPVTPKNQIIFAPLSQSFEQFKRTNHNYGDIHVEYYGVKHYRIGELPPMALKPQLYVGSNMWMHESFTTNDVNPRPNLSNWNAPSLVREKLTPVGTTLQLEGQSYNRHIVYVHANDPLITTAEFSIIGNGIIVPYLNGSRMHGNNRYSMHFVKGWNRIELCSYAGDSDTVIITDIDLLEVGTDIYAHNQPIEQITPHDLYHNTFARNLHKFAIDNNNIIVNYNPFDLSENGISYTLYHYAADDISNMSVRVMATLKRTPEATDAPRLNEYRLILE